MTSDQIADLIRERDELAAEVKRFRNQRYVVGSAVASALCWVALVLLNAEYLQWSPSSTMSRALAFAILAIFAAQGLTAWLFIDRAVRYIFRTWRTWRSQ